MTPPRQKGYHFSNWNAVNAQHHIQAKFGKAVSLRTVIRIFHKQDLKLLRPRPIPAKGDPVCQQAFYDKLRAKIQHACPRDRFLFFDACSVQRSATVSRMWWAAGDQPTVKVCGGRERLHILGVLDATGSQARFVFSKSLGAEEFLSFLRALLTAFPEDKIHLVLDNARAHHSKIVQKFVLQNCDRLELLFLPPYSPKLNPIEKFWQYLRQMVTHNTFFETYAVFQAEITAFLQQYKKADEKIRHLCQMYYRTGAIDVAAL